MGEMMTSDKVVCELYNDHFENAKRYRDKTKAQQAADNLGWIVKEVE